jgi:hypothetical protein
VSENRLLRRIFGPKREEVSGGWRTLLNVELHNLYDTPNIIRVIKSRSMGWAGHAACMRKMRNEYKTMAGKSAGKRLLYGPGVERKIILEWILGKEGGKLWTEFIWLRIGTSGGLL